MDAATIKAISGELEAALKGRRFGKIFQLSRFDIVVDFRLPESAYLFISIEPAEPRIYLIKRRVRDLERSSGNLSPFSLYLRKHLSGAEVVRFEHVPDERVLICELRADTAAGERTTFELVVQLTGRSANLFLLGERSLILESARDTKGEGQQIGDVYRPPVREGGSPAKSVEARPLRTNSRTMSESLDLEHQQKEAERRFKSIAGAARTKLAKEIGKREKLLFRLKEDLEGHGDAGKWKRFGDLLLANVTTATRQGDAFIVTDYFDESAPQIAIPAEKGDSITEAADRFFRRYTKARNAAEEIAKRIATLDEELSIYGMQRDRIAEAIEARDEQYLLDFLGRDRASARGPQKTKQPESKSGVRRFSSSDGFEILVGKKAGDNDFLTFRLAKSLDLWMHAADYPGSHVVVRNPGRKEIPQRTLLEAAQLAAFYSQAKKQPKAAVHYTQKKFVNKPRGGAPGLVSLSKFKTILVEPKVPEIG